MVQDQLSSKTPRVDTLFGGLVALVGIAVAIAIYRQPESLQVPLWLALMACLCFVLSGIALSLKSTHYTRAYQWSVVVLLLCMAYIPAWLALGSGARTCTATIPLIDSNLGCRLAFGVATAFMLPILLLAIKHAVRRPAV